MPFTKGIVQGTYFLIYRIYLISSAFTFLEEICKTKVITIHNVKWSAIGAVRSGLHITHDMICILRSSRHRWDMIWLTISFYKPVVELRSQVTLSSVLQAATTPEWANHSKWTYGFCSLGWPDRILMSICASIEVKICNKVDTNLVMISQISFTFILLSL